MKLHVLLVLLLLNSAPVLALAGPCPPDGYTREALLDIRAQEFRLADDQKRNALAIGLLGCVSDPDPAIRDGVAFEGLATWMRGDALDTATIDALYTGLMEQLADQTDVNGFQQPFAALLLAEVARTDRVKPAFTEQRRAALVAATAMYLNQITDYRGYSESEGWRHGVAHASDLVLQLVLNPNINAGQVAVLMQSLAQQVSPPGAVFYIYGEPGRLARAVFYAHRRDIISQQDWQTWMAGITAPAPLASWADAYSSQAGLAKRHNTLAFLTALLFYAEAADDENGRALAVMVMNAIQQVM